MFRLRPTTLRTTRRTTGRLSVFDSHGRILTAAAVALVSTVLLAPMPAASATPMAPSRPAQSLGDLQAQAKAIAAKIEKLRIDSDDLNEQYLETQIEVTDLQTQLAATQAEVDQAQSSLGENQQAVTTYALDAYMSGGQVDPVFFSARSASDASNRTAYLTSIHGDKQQIVSDVQAAQQDLADKTTKLTKAKSTIDAKVASQASTKKTLESAIAEQESLQASVSGQLADAVAAEQARLEQEQVAAAERQVQEEAAREAQSRAEQARRAVAPSTSEQLRSQSPASLALVDDGSESDLPSATDDTSPSKDERSFPDPGPVPPGVQAVLDAARSQLGVPYRWGASSPGSGFDCSGLVLYAWKFGGLSLPHSSRAMYAMTQRISANQLEPGDLVFGGSPIHHVALYIGGGMMIQAPHSGDVVKISGIYSSSKPVSFGRL